MPFDHNQVIQTNTDFFVVLRGANDPSYRVPASNDVRDLLCDMLGQTLASISNLDDRGEIEYGEDYGGTARLRCQIGDPTVARLVALYNANNILANTNALENPSNINFYFARFTDNLGQTCIGVKTPTSFKANIGKSILFYVNNQLQVVTDKTFKLDNEFEFIVYNDHVAILKPKQFLRIAQVDAVLAVKGPENLNEIATRMPIVDFTTIDQQVRTKKRVQQLVASIKNRTDLASASLTHLETECMNNNITVLIQNGKLIPQSGHEIGFLEYLDGRRFTHSLSGTTPDRMRAINRSKV